MQRSDESIKTYPLLQNPFDEDGEVRLKLSKTQETELFEALRQITALARPVYQIAMREVSVNRRNCERSGNKATAPSPINEKAFELYNEAAELVVYGQINVYGVTTKSERCERSYRTRSAAGNGIGGREAPVPYGS